MCFDDIPQGNSCWPLSTALGRLGDDMTRGLSFTDILAVPVLPLLVRNIVVVAVILG